jgi:hypothetical protein
MNANRHRQIFNALVKKYGSDSNPSPGFLRVEQELKNSTGTYRFAIDTQSGGQATELKLDRNDLFVVTDLAFYLLREDATKLGAQVLQTYPNETEFAAVAGPPAFTPGHLEAIYNGKFSLKIQSKVNIEAMSMHHFRYVPETQQSAATNKSMLSLGEAAYPLGSLLYLKGSMDVEVKVEFNTFDGIAIQAQTANIKNKLVFHPYGYLIKGKALVQ